MLSMEHSCNNFPVFQVELWERQESNVTDKSLDELPAWQSAMDCQDVSWAEGSGCRVRFYGTSSLPMMVESITREASRVLEIEKEPQSRDTLL